MGYGEYSYEAHQALTSARTKMSQADVFKQGSCHPLMSPYGVKHRECRDSPKHPESIGVVFALDVSRSMEDIPHLLATRTLPTFMGTVLTVLPHAQVLFMAFGNAYTDKSPLQVGQFESEAALIDKWLSLTHIESGGGGHGESYDLAMYFAARHTAMDCLLKRKKKGYFFMTGDEPCFDALRPPIVSKVLGDTIPAPILGHDMAAELLQSFHAFFLAPDPKRGEQASMWKGWLHERTITLATPEDTAAACAVLIAIQEGSVTSDSEIALWIDQRLPRSSEERDRLVRAVSPFAAALAKGPIAPPKVLPVGGDPNFRG